MFNTIKEKQTSNTLKLIELYASVQGETTLVGLPTTFIRLAACNLRCTWCDTPQSFSKGEPFTIDYILDEVERLKCQHICITGGEPLLQRGVLDLMCTLCDRGYVVSLETGGGITTEGVDPRVITILDIKCPGSGMSHKNVWANIERLRAHDEVKLVLLDRADYDYAKETCDKYKLYNKVRTVLFSPVHGKIDPKDLVKWILEDHLPVRLNLQLHKYIWSPDTLGV